MNKIRDYNSRENEEIYQSQIAVMYRQIFEPWFFNLYNLLHN